MILAIDIGNTNIVVGCIDDKKTYFIERLSTVRTKTELEYAVDLKTVLDIYHIKKTDIEGCIISSVVPQITNIAKLAAEKILKKEVMVLGPGVKTGLNIMLDNPGQLGADLVANAVAGLNEYPVPFIVIDMGTATTVSVVNDKKQYIGGMIMPGVGVSLDALTARASQLSGISIDAPKHVLGKNTIECMKRYPEEGFSMDWYGTLATMFHDVGKLYTAEHLNGRWTFYQHHRVGAGVTRKILRRLHFTSEDIDLICHLVRHHMMFHFMLTDRGIRRFKALPETERLIAMCRADIEARDGSYTYFNHNSKYLTRAETDELLLEPLLNGNEIMEYTSLPPGPAVGTIREALLKAQVAGEVTDRDSAIAFVKNYAAKLK